MYFNFTNQGMSMVPNTAISIVQMTKCGATLEIRLCEPVERVIANYQLADVVVDVFTFHGLGYLLSKFGDESWTAAPFHASQNTVKHRGIPVDFTDDTAKAGLYVLLCDQRGHQEFGGRCVSLDRRVTKEIADLIGKQMTKPVTKREFGERVQSAKQAFMPNQMAAMSATRRILQTFSTSQSTKHK